MSFIKELKRRNVFKVGIAYLASSWLLLQISDVILGNFETPGWIFQAILWLVVVGFPVALVFAWAFEMTPEGLRKDEDVDRSGPVNPAKGRILNAVIIATLVLAVGYFAYDEFVIEPAQDSITVDVSQNSIAVLPFENLSSDPEQDYFAAGLSEDILNLLARVPQLKVIGLETVTRLRDADIDVIRISAGVSVVLRGTIRRSDDSLRITAQLIDASDGTQIWSDSYDRTMTDVFAVQDDVAARIIEALQIQVGALPTRGLPTNSAEAYTGFLKARILLNSQRGFEASEILLQVLELDPKFAEAIELLAYSYWQQGTTTITADESQELTGAAAQAALAIDPDLPFAEALFRMATDTRGGLDGINALERARVVQPSNPDLMRMLIYELTARGYIAEAHDVAQQFAAVDPLSPVANFSLGETLYALGRTEEAMPHITFAEELGNYFAERLLPQIDLIEGRYESAIERFEQDLLREGIDDRDWIGELITATRENETGQVVLDSRIPRLLSTIQGPSKYHWQHQLNMLYLLFGYHDRFFELVRDAEPEPETWTAADVLMWEGTVFRRSGFTAHPDYPDIAEQLGFFEIWDERGPPDFCEKVSGDWVCE